MCRMSQKSKTPIGNRKCIFWKTSINDQRPKLRVSINGIFIEDLLNVGADVSNTTLESWHENWPLLDVDVKSLRTGTIS